MGLTSTTKGLGLDISCPIAVQCKNAMRGMGDWINATGSSIKNSVTNNSTVLYNKLAEILEQGMCDQADRKVAFAPIQYTTLLGSAEALKRNAHTEPRSLATVHTADWGALLAP